MSCNWGRGAFALTDGLSLDANGVTVRGAGMDTTVLDFTAQQGARRRAAGYLGRVTLRDFAVENAKGDGIKSKGADNIVYYRVRGHLDRRPEGNQRRLWHLPGAKHGRADRWLQGIGRIGCGDLCRPVQGDHRSLQYVEQNVAGIEIENSRDALVTGNLVTRNTGGVLVFDLPNLPVWAAATR